MPDRELNSDAIGRVKATIHQINGHWWNRRKRPEAPDLRVVLDLAMQSERLKGDGEVERVAKVLWPLQEWDGEYRNAEDAARAVIAALSPDGANREPGCGG